MDNISTSSSLPPSQYSVSPTIRVGSAFHKLERRYQYYVDRTTPHWGGRWFTFGLLFVIFLLRIVTLQGFYVVAYALGIYLLNIFLLFLSPKFDPASEDEDALGNDAAVQDAPTRLLPLGRDDEFRPFVRRLPEFRFWYNSTWATTVALVATLFPVLDIPVFWPILLFYWILLTVVTLRRQIAHMIKYKYIPFDIGRKKQYGMNTSNNSSRS